MQYLLTEEEYQELTTRLRAANSLAAAAKRDESLQSVLETTLRLLVDLHGLCNRAGQECEICEHVRRSLNRVATLNIGFEEWEIGGSRQSPHFAPYPARDDQGHAVDLRACNHCNQYINVAVPSIDVATYDHRYFHVPCTNSLVALEYARDEGFYIAGELLHAAPPQSPENASGAPDIEQNNKEIPNP
jgi:hypothetical protein